MLVPTIWQKHLTSASRKSFDTQTTTSSPIFYNSSYLERGAGLYPLLLRDNTASYIYGPGGLLVEQVQGSTPYYYHPDQLGSIRALTDASGTVQNTYQYDAYGTTTSGTGSVANPFRYAGEYRDSESGLYYLRARYYDPATQQFLTRDPLAALTGTPYAYAGGSPLNGGDPSGLAASSGDERASNNPGEALWWYQVHYREKYGHDLDPWDWGPGWEQIGALLFHFQSSSAPCGGAADTFRGPAAKNFDIDHMYDKHHPQGKDAPQRGPDNSLWPEQWTKDDMARAVKRAWQNRARVETQESPDGTVRIRYRGFDSESDLTIDMWYNTNTKTVETGYPVDVPIEIPIELPFGGE